MDLAIICSNLQRVFRGDPDYLVNFDSELLDVAIFVRKIEPPQSGLSRNFQDSHGDPVFIREITLQLPEDSALILSLRGLFSDDLLYPVKINLNNNILK